MVHERQRKVSGGPQVEIVGSVPGKSLLKLVTYRQYPLNVIPTNGQVRHFEACPYVRRATDDLRTRSRGGETVINDLVVTLGLLGAGAAATGVSTWVNGRRHQRADHRRCGLWDVIKTWIEGRVRIALERERRATRVETLRLLTNLPHDVSIIERADGGQLIRLKTRQNVALLNRTRSTSPIPS
jgi:hypothetical protein